MTTSPEHTEYTGRVQPGGPAQTRRAGGLTITKVAVDPEMSNNSYLLRCEATGDQLLVDAAAEPEVLLALIGEAGLTSVVTTHRHWDHHRALAEVVAATGAEVVAGAQDADAITADTGVSVTRRVAHGDRIAVGDCALEVIDVVGHTPGSIVLVHDDSADGGGVVHLLTGDSLFPGGPGRTESPDDFARLFGDLEERVFDRFGDDAWFYPGHGDDSTLGVERPALPQWRERGW